MKYSMDTSAILECWRRNYPPDVFPGLWQCIDDLINVGDLRATEEVRVELERKDDELLEWAKARNDLFVPIDEDIQIAVQQILVTHGRLLDTRKSRSGADPFVIALAQINNCAVLSNERATNSPTRPNIPDVCLTMNIRCLTVIELIREQEWVFS